MGVDPSGELGGVETEEVSPLDVRNALLVDETADMTDIDAELLCDVADADKTPWSWLSSRGHVFVLLLLECLSCGPRASR
jgi:hypothetical protein